MAGVAFAISAYGIWGFIPLYFKLVGHVDALTILAHRVLWSLPILAGLIVAFGGGRRLRGLVINRRMWLVLPATAGLLATNWLLFVLCMLTGRVLQASLAYYITPLMMTGLGVVVLRESLRPMQVAGLSLAGLGVVGMVWASGWAELPWMAVLIAMSWSLYGLLRRVNRVPAIEGVSVELSILAPMALGWMLLAGPVPGESPNALAADWALLALGGPVTAIPLLCFGAAATRVNLTTLGFLQYLAPTLQFLLGVLVYHEPFGWRRGVAFGLIWAAIAVYTLDTVRVSRKKRARGAVEPAPRPVPVAAPVAPACVSRGVS